MLSNEWCLIKRRKRYRRASFRRMPSAIDRLSPATSYGGADSLAFTAHFDARPSARRLLGAVDLVTNANSGRERCSLWRRQDCDGAQLEVFALLGVQVRRVAVNRRDRATRVVRRETAAPTQAIVFELLLVG
jgi:hypothetical protein